jgi:ABC-2 type transport system permease protein
MLGLIDCAIMAQRSSRHVLRRKDAILGALLQPLMFLVLFAWVFVGAISKSLPSGTNYLAFLLPGVIVQSLAFGSISTALNVKIDLTSGVMDRFRSLPINSLSVLAGHVIADQLRNGISTAVILAAGVIMGFRSHAPLASWIEIIGLLMLFTFAFSWLAAIVGLIAKSLDGVQWMSFVITFPLSFASTAFVPASSMPGQLRNFAENQPLSQVVDAVRALMLGQPVGDHGWLSVAWRASILIVALLTSSYLFRRKITQ